MSSPFSYGNIKDKIGINKRSMKSHNAGLASIAPLGHPPTPLWDIGKIHHWTLRVHLYSLEREDGRVLGFVNVATRMVHAV